MKKSTYVYIDGFNLYYRLKKTSLKWLDLGKFANSCLDTQEHNIQKIKYFTTRVKRSEDDPNKTTRQDTYLRAIRTIPKLEIVFGQFKRRTIKGVLCDSRGRETDSIVMVKKYEEKKSDVNIATHIIADGYEGKYDCLVLISNDTDLVTPLQHIKYKVKKMVIVISPFENIHVDLKKSSHYYRGLSSEDDIFKANQFPLEITTPVGKIHCPEGWI